VALRNPVTPGAALELRDRGLRCEAARAEPLVAPDGTALDRARAGDVIRLSGRFETQPGGLVRLPNEGSAAGPAAGT
jgi:hypothetical protein